MEYVLSIMDQLTQELIEEGTLLKSSLVFALPILNYSVAPLALFISPLTLICF